MGAVRDPKDRTIWRWTGSGDEISVSFWSQPQGTPRSDADCARYDGSRGWLWSDTPCNARLNYICQHREYTRLLPILMINFTIEPLKLRRRFETGYASPRVTPRHPLTPRKRDNVIFTVAASCFYSDNHRESHPPRNYAQQSLPGGVATHRTTTSTSTSEEISLEKRGISNYCAENPRAAAPPRNSSLRR